MISVDSLPASYFSFIHSLDKERLIPVFAIAPITLQLEPSKKLQMTRRCPHFFVNWTVTGCGS